MFFQVPFLLGLICMVHSSQAINQIIVTCSTYTVTTGQPVTCNFTTSFTCPQIQVGVDFGDSTSTSFSQTQNVDHGIQVPTSAPTSYTISTTYEYLCLNTELLQDENVTSVEFYMYNAGLVSLKMMEWDVHSLGTKASDYILATNTATSYTDLVTLWSGPADVGYNKITFSPPVSYPKGTLLDFYLDNGVVAINNVSTAPIKDYSWSLNVPLPVGQNLFVNVITEPTYGQMNGSVFTITHNYSTAGTYNILAQFSCNSTLYTDSSIIDVTSANMLVLSCASVEFDIVEDLSCSITSTYSCNSAYLLVDYNAAGVSADNITLAPGNMSTMSQSINKFYTATGAFSMVASLICDNTRTDVQQIITVTDVGIAINSTTALRCLECKGTTCGDLIYRVGTSIVECDDNVQWCQKFVFYNGVIHRSCADPEITECTSKELYDATYGTALKYCCSDDLCNSSPRQRVAHWAITCIAFAVLAIFAQFFH